jgi:hypothetical protein
MNNKAFNLVEMMIAVAFSVILLTGVYGFFNAASQTYTSGVSGQALENGANVILSKILEGATEGNSPGTVYRLSTAKSYYIPNLNTLYYCQDSPCSAADATARHYTLDLTNTKILYYHPTTNPLGYDIIYQAPTGSTLILRFLPATAHTSFAVEIDVALKENLAAIITNQRLAVSGTASTFVLLRDHCAGLCS